MSKELKYKTNGENGAITFTLSDILRRNGKKQSQTQIGKLKVQKCAIIWFDGYETGNNKFKVTWDEFIDYMKKHPADKKEISNAYSKG